MNVGLFGIANNKVTIALCDLPGSKLGHFSLIIGHRFRSDFAHPLFDPCAKTALRLFLVVNREA